MSMLADGEIDVAIYDPALPLASLPSGVLMKIACSAITTLPNFLCLESANQGVVLLCHALYRLIVGQQLICQLVSCLPLALFILRGEEVESSEGIELRRRVRLRVEGDEPLFLGSLEKSHVGRHQGQIVASPPLHGRNIQGRAQYERVSGVEGKSLDKWEGGKHQSI